MNAYNRRCGFCGDIYDASTEAGTNVIALCCPVCLFGIAYMDYDDDEWECTDERRDHPAGEDR